MVLKLVQLSQLHPKYNENKESENNIKIKKSGKWCIMYLATDKEDEVGIGKCGLSDEANSFSCLEKGI